MVKPAVLLAILRRNMLRMHDMYWSNAVRQAPGMNLEGGTSVTILLRSQFCRARIVKG